MPSKYYQRQFYPQTFHHIYNRGAHKANIFQDKEDYHIFTQILSYYLTFPQNKPPSLLSRFKKPNLPKHQPYHLIAYVLMPNHYHLFLKQIDKEPTISNLIKRLSNTYVAYYNKKYQHSGTLFQGKYKSVPVKTEKQFKYLSIYIHQNPHNLTQKLANYPYSSYPAYINKTKTPPWLHPEYIDFKPQSYQQLVEKDFHIPEIISPITLD